MRIKINKPDYENPAAGIVLSAIMMLLFSIVVMCIIMGTGYAMDGLTIQIIRGLHILAMVSGVLLVLITALYIRLEKQGR